jgi:transglutaminase-like putative cysteine protease
MRLRIQHETVYQYDQPAYASHNEVRLQPLDDELQRCLSFQLSTEPPSTFRSRHDYFGNVTHYFSIPGYHRRLVIRSEALVLTFPPAVLGPPRDRPLPLANLVQPQMRGPLTEFLAPSPCAPLSTTIQGVATPLAASAGGDGARFWDALLAFMKENIRYEPGSTTVEDDADRVLERRHGVCQDFAHLTIALARAAGVPARYVSGYVRPVDGLGEASHAWAELFLPTAGWVGLDGSGPGPIDERYARVAFGRDYTDANPVRGTFSGGGHQALSVDVTVQHQQQQQ